MIFLCGLLEQHINRVSVLGCVSKTSCLFMTLSSKISELRLKLYIKIALFCLVLTLGCFLFFLLKGYPDKPRCHWWDLHPGASCLGSGFVLHLYSKWGDNPTWWPPSRPDLSLLQRLGRVQRGFPLHCGWSSWWRYIYSKVSNNVKDKDPWYDRYSQIGAPEKVMCPIV